MGQGPLLRMERRWAAFRKNDGEVEGWGCLKFSLACHARLLLWEETGEKGARSFDIFAFPNCSHITNKNITAIDTFIRI
jgi:hypothetical protein